MGISKISKLNLIKYNLWGSILISTLALVYHIRWFVPYLLNSVTHEVPIGQSPLVWFLVQILSNVTFLFVGYCLIRLFNKYEQTGFFDSYSLNVFDKVIVSCIFLAMMGVIKLAFSQFHPLPLSEYKSIWGAINLFTFLFIDVVTFKEPQTMYLLMAIIIWAVKQFSIKALLVKSENEAFI